MGQGRTSRWDIFCRVVDNYGDIGVCWRLARQLAAEHGLAVRLWVDRLESFARLCPSLDPRLAAQFVGAVEVRRWDEDFPAVDAADVVIEAFACELPERYVTAMIGRARPPVWVNLEYLSAEEWVEECHRLPSPQRGLSKYFFFPGFTPRTGGLLRERGLLEARAAFDEAAAETFWRSIGVPGREPGELRVSLFCYENAALPELLEAWAAGPSPVRLFATPGFATPQIAAWAGRSLEPEDVWRRGGLTVHALPFLPPDDYDRLLWACDVNFVRGEDSFVRAQWAQRPFVWQIYPQSDQAHLVKLRAFLDRFSVSCPAGAAVRRCWEAWNGGGGIGPAWGDFHARREAIEGCGKLWAGQLDQTGDLANNLVLLSREHDLNL